MCMKFVYGIAWIRSFFCLLSGTPMNEDTIICSLIPLLTNNCVSSLANINRVATEINVQVFFGRMLSFLLHTSNYHLGVELRGYSTVVCLVLLETVRTFHQVFDHFPFTPTMYKIYSSSTFLPTHGVLILLILVILLDV